MRRLAAALLLCAACGGAEPSTSAKVFGLACKYGATPDPACGSFPDACFAIGCGPSDTSGNCATLGFRYAMCSRWCGYGCPVGTVCSESDPHLGICYAKCSTASDCPAGSVCDPTLGGTCKPG